MFRRASAILICLALVANALALSSCAPMARSGETSQNGDASSDSPKTTLPEDSDSTDDTPPQESEPASGAQQSSGYSELPVIDIFEASPEEITEGMTSTLTWEVRDATSASISHDIGSVDMSGTMTVSPVTTTDYTLTADNEYDTVTATIIISVIPEAGSTGLPVINSFLAEPENISEGETSSLSWSISNASSFTIGPNVFRQTGPIVITGDTPDNAAVSPSITTSYTLTAINDIGSVEDTVTVMVSPQAVFDWSGTWDTNWGTMYLTQSLGKVTGTYEYDDGRIEGYISKNLSGNMVAGTWSEYPSYKPPDDAGDIEFAVSPDGSSFTGRWRYGASGDWNGDWSGTRISP